MEIKPGILPPHGLEGGCVYKIEIPDTIKAENGKTVAKSSSKFFTTKWEKAVEAEETTQNIITQDGMYMIFPDMDYNNGGDIELRISVTDDSVNRVEVYPVTELKEDIENSAKGEKLGEIVVIGKGDYSISVTDHVINCDGSPAFFLVAKKEAGEYIVNKVDFDAPSDIKISGGSFVRQEVSDDNLPDGDGNAWKNSYSLRFSTHIDKNNNLSNNFQYRSQTMFGTNQGIKATPLDESDYGRRFEISYRVYDTTRRLLTNNMYAGAKGGKIDSDGYQYSFFTKPNEWSEFKMEYSIDDRDDWELFDKRNFEVVGEIKSIAVLPADVAVAPRGYAAGVLGEAKGGNCVGTKGLNGDNRVYSSVADAESAGEIMVLREQPIYFDDLTVTEIVTDVTIATENGKNGNVPVLVTHPERVFTDVTASDWFYDCVKSVRESKLMNGITDSEFEPYTEVTRAMFVTAVWRLNGSPEVDYADEFEDVADGAWYEKAVKWAAAKGITNGITDTEFMPESRITREDMATMILRLSGDEVSCGELAYKDAEDISPYAADGVSYCYSEDIMTGDNNDMFLPKAFATRAELAAVLGRLK